MDDLRAGFVLYDYEFTTKDGRRSDKMFLFSYMPENCNNQDRIATAHALKGFHAECSGTILCEVDDKDNFTDFIVAEEPDPTRM